MKSSISRRRFLSRAASAIGAGLAAPAIFPRGILGAESPSEKIITGHIGVGGMGTGHVNNLKDRVGAICDCYEPHLQRAAKIVGRYVPLYKDFRKLLDQKDIDGIVVATPDHWHGVMCVYGCEAGKDVYVQKPASVTIEEGRAMVRAAERCGRVVQVGSQGRSTPAAYHACAYVRNGALGKVSRVTCWHYENPVGGFSRDSEPPKDLDWDLWLGPLRWVPYNRDRCPGVFRWFLEDGGGQIRDRGAHVMSCAMFIMASDHTGPATIEATGEAPKRGLWDCPPTMNVTYQFKDPDWTMSWNQPGEPTAIPGEKEKRGYGAVYTGEKGTLIVAGGDGGTWTEEKASKFEIPAGGYQPYKSPGHEEDWLECIKTRKKPIMHIEAGHRVATLCILGNISYILKRKLHWDPVAEKVIGDEEANRMLSRPNRAPWHI
jgi:predicted dehydrogenase